MESLSQIQSRKKCIKHELEISIIHCYVNRYVNWVTFHWDLNVQYQSIIKHEGCLLLLQILFKYDKLYHNEYDILSKFYKLYHYENFPSMNQWIVNLFV
jgi:hypothetical protein